MSIFTTALTTNPHDQQAIETLRRDRDCYRAIALAALDSLHASYARVTMLERQLSDTRMELRRYTSEKVS